MNKADKLSVYGCMSFLLLLYLFTASNLNFGKNKWKSILEVDARGYYAYLPAIIIYNDLNFNFFNQVEKSDECEQQFTYEYRVLQNNKHINKYFAGTAFSQLPFFLAAHIYSIITGAPLTGYSKAYMISVSIAACFYVMAGLMLLFFILRMLDLKTGFNILIIISYALGTQLFYYATCEPGMSHVYSFFFVNLWIYAVLNFIRAERTGYLLLAGFALGMVVLIRPVNIIIIAFIPFLSALFKHQINVFQILLSNRRPFLLSLLIFASIVSIQPLIYYMQCGSFFAYAYGDEKFIFSQPHFFNILFSFRKGLFIYTPLVLLAHAGLVSLYNIRKAATLYYLTAFVLINWIISSWWIWYYGGSFGLRAYMEYYGFFAILMRYLFYKQEKTIFRFILPLIVVILLLCQYQTYLYRYNVIHWSEMDAKKYVEALLYIFR